MGLRVLPLSVASYTSICTRKWIGLDRGQQSRAGTAVTCKGQGHGHCWLFQTREVSRPLSLFAGSRGGHPQNNGAELLRQVVRAQPEMWCQGLPWEILGRGGKGGIWGVFSLSTALHILKSKHSPILQQFYKQKIHLYKEHLSESPDLSGSLSSFT